MKTVKQVKAQSRSTPLLISRGGDGQPKHDEIARLAHSIWRAEGCPVGRDLDHWLQAESELRQPQPRSRSGPRA